MSLAEGQYITILQEIKEQIYSARHRAVLGANKELICLYWNIGKRINSNASWGNKFIDTLAKDIKTEFPDASGYSVRNLKYMAKFAQEFTNFEIVQQLIAQMPWGHILTVLEKVKDDTQRIWYVQKVIENSWSRAVLVHQIELNLYQRQAIAPTTNNFDKVLPSPHKELALETLKDSYIFDFLTLQEDITEKAIEQELVKHVSKLLLELGTGFAFMGNQYHLEVGGEDFYLDLLFYNLKLRSYVVIELKTGKFKPEYAGKLNFYLSAVDNMLKSDMDNPSIGILLCKEKNTLIAEFALKDMTKPMGISEYKLTSVLPKELEEALPSVEDLQERMQRVREEHK